MEVVTWDGRASWSASWWTARQHTTEWRKGAQVEVEEEMVNAIALGREGRSLDEEEMTTRCWTPRRPM